jgi:hypothetical protein
VIGFTAGAAMLGCATPNSVEYSAINSPPRAFVRRAPADVEVFVGRPPTRPHVDVGLFEVYQGYQDDGVRRSTEDMIGTLRFHGGLRGCDAVQVMGVELAGKHEWRVVRGVCEMYTDEQAQRDASRAPAAASQPLPGEGKSWTAQDNGPMTTTPVPCPDPLVCVSQICVSPYR